MHKTCFFKGLSKKDGETCESCNGNYGRESCSASSDDQSDCAGFSEEIAKANHFLTIESAQEFLGKHFRWMSKTY